MKVRTHLEKPDERRDRLVELERRDVLADADSRPVAKGHVTAFHGQPARGERFLALGFRSRPCFAAHPPLGLEFVCVGAKDRRVPADTVRGDAHRGAGREVVAAR